MRGWSITAASSRRGGMVHLVRTQSASAYSLSPRLADRIAGQGIPCRHHVLPTPSFYRRQSRLLRLVQRMVYTGIYDRWFSARIRPGDVVWIYGSGGLAFAHTRLERMLRARGAKLLFWLTDAWHLQSPAFAQACTERVEAASLTGVVTPQLAESFRERYPRHRCVLLEEAVDTDAVRPVPRGGGSVPLVVWTGPSPTKSDLGDLLPVLADAHRQTPFEFKVISGNRRPQLDAPIPWSWAPHSVARESENLAAAIAVAQYPDTPYGRCKGNYKVKTYMAAGCAVVTSRVGYNTTMIEHGHSGLLVGTSEEWSAALRELLVNPGRASELGRNARHVAETRFSYAALVPGYVDVLRSLLD